MVIVAIRSFAAYIAVSLYVLIVAPPGMLVAYLFGAKKHLYVLGHLGVRLGLLLTGIRYRVAGAGHVPRDRAAVYCANHQSNVDPPILFDAVHPMLHILYKAELNAIPVLTRAFRFGGFIAVDRRNKEAAMRSIEAGAASIWSGINPQPESYWGNVNPVGPRGVYDEAKRFAEAMTMAYHRYHRMQVRIVRIFNTYGPRMRIHDGRAIPNFIGQALHNRPITIYGDGSQTRSFCYVDDLVDGLYRLLMSNANEPVNIGNPHEMTLLELAEKVRRLAHSKSRLVYRALPQDDPKVRRPDIRLAREKLHWEPRVAFDVGLKRTIDYFRKGVKRA